MLPIQAHRDWFSLHEFLGEEFDLGLPGYPVPRPAQARLHRYDVIVGVDTMRRRQFIVFGRRSLRHAIATRRPDRLRICYAELDADSPEFGVFLNVVKCAKGHHDYEGYRGNPLRNPPLYEPPTSNP